MSLVFFFFIYFPHRFFFFLCLLFIFSSRWQKQWSSEELYLKEFPTGIKNAVHFGFDCDFLSNQTRASRSVFRSFPFQLLSTTFHFVTCLFNILISNDTFNHSLFFCLKSSQFLADQLLSIIIWHKKLFFFLVSFYQIPRHEILLSFKIIDKYW